MKTALSVPGDMLISTKRCEPYSRRRPFREAIVTQHHFVSKGYQNNFANTGQRLAIVNARTGDVVRINRPTKSNWTAPDWNSIKRENGLLDADLEAQWSKVEASTLRRIREVRVDSCDMHHRASIINLFAIHLVRSPALADVRARLLPAVFETSAQEIETDPEVVDYFRREYNRDPCPGEIAQMSRSLMDKRESTNVGLVESMVDGHNTIAETLSRFYIQIVEIPEHLPGFVLGDVPVFHGNLKHQKFGFHDGLAVGDADLVMAPLTRRTLACFSAQPLPNQTIRTKSQVLKVNNLLVRVAEKEVACHPDDTMVLRRLCQSPSPFVRP
jgi:hypothetical protein